MKYFLTIAASDNSGGAGIQQDLKVAYNFDMWVLTAITGVTVQNFNELKYLEPVSGYLFKLQLESCLQSFPVSVIKIGALCSHKNILITAELLRKYSQVPVVLDTVFAASGGKAFLDSDAIETMKKELFPLATVITPNKNEFEFLTGQKYHCIEDAAADAQFKAVEWKTSIFLKGGHFEGAEVNEALVTEDEIFFLKKKRNTFHYSHGTGCAFSTALACSLVQHENLKSACRSASGYIEKLYNSLNSDCGIN